MTGAFILPAAEAVWARGWGQTRYSRNQGCVACPCCDTLISSVWSDGSTKCHGCDWMEGEPIDRERPSIHNEAGRLLREAREAKEREEAEDLQRRLKHEIWTNGYLSAQADARLGITTASPYLKVPA